MQWRYSSLSKTTFGNHDVCNRRILLFKLTIVSIAVPAVWLIVNPTGTGERLRVFEMGGGGHRVEFRKTGLKIRGSCGHVAKKAGL